MRRCDECGRDVSDRAPSAGFCVPCAHERKLDRTRQYRALHRRLRDAVWAHWCEVQRRWRHAHYRPVVTMRTCDTIGCLTDVNTRHGRRFCDDCRKANRDYWSLASHRSVA